MVKHIITVAVPSIPYGPVGVPAREADADYYRDAAKNIRLHAAHGQAFAGSNLTETVARLCDATSQALANPAGTEVPGTAREALEQAVWSALEPRLEDVIRLDLNTPDGNTGFAGLVRQVVDAVMPVLGGAAGR